MLSLVRDEPRDRVRKFPSNYCSYDFRDPGKVVARLKTKTRRERERRDKERISADENTRQNRKKRLL